MAAGKPGDRYCCWLGAVVVSLWLATAASPVIAQGGQADATSSRATQRPRMVGAAREGGAIGNATPGSNGRLDMEAIRASSKCVQGVNLPNDAGLNEDIAILFTACAGATLGEAKIQRDGNRVHVTQPWCFAQAGDAPAQSHRIALGRLPPGDYSLDFTESDDCHVQAPRRSMIASLHVSDSDMVPGCLMAGRTRAAELGGPPPASAAVAVARVTGVAACDVMLSSLASSLTVAATSEQAILLGLTACAAGTEHWLLRVPAAGGLEPPAAFVDGEGRLYVDVPRDRSPSGRDNVRHALLAACLAAPPRGLLVFDSAERRAFERERSTVEAENRQYFRTRFFVLLFVTTVLLAVGVPYFWRTRPATEWLLTAQGEPPPTFGAAGVIAGLSWVFTAISLFCALSLLAESPSDYKARGVALILGTFAAWLQSGCVTIALVVFFAGRRPEPVRFLAWRIAPPTALAWLPLYLFGFGAMAFFAK